jgi:hypothetical protein
MLSSLPVVISTILCSNNDINDFIAGKFSGIFFLCWLGLGLGIGLGLRVGVKGRG